MAPLVAGMPGCEGRPVDDDDGGVERRTSAWMCTRQNLIVIQRTIVYVPY